MGSSRLQAFSDGVFAIIITIIVLGIRVPQGTSLEDLLALLPVFLSYALSFLYIGIYWNNHHHMLHVTSTVTGGVLWANLHLLFWLSLLPFATGWIGENPFAMLPTAVYGSVLLLAGCAYFILEQVIIRAQGPDSVLKRAVGRDLKGKVSVLLCAAAIVAAFRWVWLADLIFVVVALLWLVPDRRVEHAVRATRAPGQQSSASG